jgi:DNA-binding FadR family transcriptional regulator
VSIDSAEAIFAPVRSQTAFEETVDRLGTAIKLGLLAPGAQLPPERELCARLGIARSTLRQALTALGQSGHLYAQRGRGGGTFVADRPPPTQPPTAEDVAQWRDVCDWRLSVELGVTVLAVERATADELDALAEVVDELDDLLEDFPAYRQGDVRFHMGLAEAARSPRLIVAMTEAQSAMTDLIAHIAHPPEVLDWSNDQHRRLVGALRSRDADAAARLTGEHLHGTEHVLAGLLP